MTMQKKTMTLAVQYLYGKGIIKKDIDIANKTGYNKSTVSSYISGRIEPSQDFVQAFEKSFKIKLSDFKEGGQHETVLTSDPLQLISERLLQVFAISRVNQSLLLEILSNQSGKTVMELQRIVSSAMDEELKQIVRELKQGGS